MIYKFKSKAAGDVIMLQPNGQKILEIVGKDGAASQGIILPAEMKAATNALNAAIAQEEAEQKAAVAQALADGKTAPKFEGISLRQRAHPFIEMLGRCEKAGKEIVWGV
jgi:hypothetical protein